MATDRWPERASHPAGSNDPWQHEGVRDPSQARAPRWRRALAQTRVRLGIGVALVSLAGASLAWAFGPGQATRLRVGAAHPVPAVVGSPPESVIAPPVAPTVTPPALAVARPPESAVAQPSAPPSCAGSPGYLVRLVREASSFRVRTRAAYALGSQDPSGCRDVLHALLVAVEHDAEAAVRAAAADSLGRIGDASTRPGLIVAAYVDPNVDVRAYARSALDALHVRLRPRSATPSPPVEPE